MSAQVAALPRFPRAMFIAAFAIAGASTTKLRPQPIARMTESREARRDRSITHIVRHLGRAILAAGDASDRFIQRGGAYEAPRPAQRRADVAALAIAKSQAVEALIGRCGLAPSIDAPWVEVDREAAAPCVRLYWRGDLIRGDRVVRVFGKSATGGEIVEHSKSEAGESARTLDLERFTEAVEAAKSALRLNGVRLSSFAEVRRLTTPSLAAGEAFKGLVATIGLAKIQTPLVVLVK